MDLLWLGPDKYDFPLPESALVEPNGLLAAGGDLSPERLMAAYERGIFPWYEDGQPILWWSPDPRMILFPNELHVSRSLNKVIREAPFKITCDQNFEGVLNACASSRKDSTGTWITTEMLQAYTRLHTLGYAHSIEVWHEEKLAGGLYGIAIGDVFFGESMFHTISNASKVAFVCLVRKLLEHNFRLIDCQISSSHLATFGAREISRSDFLTLLQNCEDRDSFQSCWPLEFDRDGW